MRRIREQPLLTYGIAVALVAIAVLARWAIGDYVGLRAPFITFFPVVILAAIIGGLWPGVLAATLCSLAAWYLFLEPTFSWTLEQRELVQLLLFALISAINIGLVMFIDVLLARVLAHEQNLHVLIENAPTGIVVVDEKGAIRLVNPSVEKLFGYVRSELLGRNVDVLVPVPQADGHRRLREVFLKSPETRPMGGGRDLHARRKDGSEFPVEIGLNPVERNGRRGVLATVIDISDRRRALDSQQLVIRELQHRTQNLFAVFQAFATRTIGEAKTLAEAKFVLSGRIKALAGAYAMLADNAWEGVSVAKILERQFSGFSQRVRVSGCDLMVGPSAAQQFALVIHELATNSLKYGALSSQDGRVSIEGEIVRSNGSSIFSFEWKELDGPPVLAPTRRGFGSVILLDSARAFGKHVSLNYLPAGVTYELHIDLDTLAGPISIAAQQPAAGGR